MNLVKTIRGAVESGNIILGTKQCLNTIQTGKAKFFVVASNCEETSLEDLTRYASFSGAEIHSFDGSSIELGEVCGKPFVVSMLAVLEGKEHKGKAKGKK
jgi:large subunit ribosomal protein L30e